MAKKENRKTSTQAKAAPSRNRILAFAKKHKMVTFLVGLTAFLSSLVAVLSWCGITPAAYFQNQAEKYNNLGYDALDAGNYVDAIEYFDKAIAFEPYHINKIDVCYFNRGRAYYKLGEYEKAVDDFTTAIALNPKDKYYLERALTYGIMGETDKQLKDYLSSMGKP